jgi:hypothetical protein
MVLPIEVRRHRQNATVSDVGRIPHFATEDKGLSPIEKTTPASAGVEGRCSTA